MKKDAFVRCDLTELNNENAAIGIAVTPKTEKRRILLHSCCGPCSTACIERLTPDWHITVFFYNPNITERDEYELRKANQKKFIEAYNAGIENPDDRVDFIEREYIPEDFFNTVAGLENCREGGERCKECIKLRLERTAKAALELTIPVFGTTLSVSPHKDFRLISVIGSEIAEIYGLEFLNLDFKKKAGFQRSIEMSKEYELYRQSYCGCVYSKREEK